MKGNIKLDRASEVEVIVIEALEVLKQYCIKQSQDNDDKCEMCPLCVDKYDCILLTDDRKPKEWDVRINKRIQL